MSMSSIFTLCSEVGNIFFKASFKWTVSAADLGSGGTAVVGTGVGGNRETGGKRPDNEPFADTALPLGCIRKCGFPGGGSFPLVGPISNGMPLRNTRNNIGLEDPSDEYENKRIQSLPKLFMSLTSDF